MPSTKKDSNSDFEQEPHREELLSRVFSLLVRTWTGKEQCRMYEIVTAFGNCSAWTERLFDRVLLHCFSTVSMVGLRKAVCVVASSFFVSASPAASCFRVSFSPFPFPSTKTRWIVPWSNRVVFCAWTHFCNGWLDPQDGEKKSGRKGRYCLPLVCCRTRLKDQEKNGGPCPHCPPKGPKTTSQTSTGQTTARTNARPTGQDVSGPSTRSLGPRFSCQPHTQPGRGSFCLWNEPLLATVPTRCRVSSQKGLSTRKRRLKQDRAELRERRKETKRDKTQRLGRSFARKRCRRRRKIKKEGLREASRPGHDRSDRVATHDEETREDCSRHVIGCPTATERDRRTIMIAELLEASSRSTVDDMDGRGRKCKTVDRRVDRVRVCCLRPSF